MSLQLISIVVLIILISFLLLGINVFIFRRKFPDTHIGHNKHMKKMGIKCVKHEEIALHGHKKKIINPEDIKIISS